MPLKLLISARDPGAAKCMVPIMRSALRHELIIPRLVAQSPAFELLAGEGFPVRRVRCTPLHGVKDPRKAELFRETDEILASERPDALLTGLSGPGIGIDESLTHRGTQKLKYAVQDFDGLVVPGFGKAAPTYFVSSEWAAARTRRFPGVTPVVVGSLPHIRYGSLSPGALRETGRTALGKEGERTIVGFYGQPAWQWSGYRRSIEQFAAAVCRVMPDALLVYRPHPKESPAERDETLRLFSSAEMETLLDPNYAIETSLCVPDLVVTCYSLCGTDQIYLQRQSDVPLGTVLYLFFESDLVRTYRSDSGSELPWPVQDDLAFVAKQASEIDGLLTLCVSPATAARVWERIRARVVPAVDATDVLIKRILDDAKLAL